LIKALAEPGHVLSVVEAYTGLEDYFGLNPKPIVKNGTGNVPGSDEETGILPVFLSFSKGCKVDLIYFFTPI
jgi:hypothetical protein